MSRFSGGCACGAVRYEILATPLMAGHCQCRDCQRTTGTGHASMLAFPSEAVKLEGSLKFHSVTTDSGNTASRGFCPECGAFVCARTSGMPGMMTIAAGSLDDPSLFVPQMVVYAQRGQSWDSMDPALARFDAMPPGTVGPG